MHQCTRFSPTATRSRRSSVRNHLAAATAEAPAGAIPTMCRSNGSSLTSAAGRLRSWFANARVRAVPVRHDGVRWHKNGMSVSSGYDPRLLTSTLLRRACVKVTRLGFARTRRASGPLAATMIDRAVGIALPCSPGLQISVLVGGAMIWARRLHQTHQDNYRIVRKPRYGQLFRNCCESTDEEQYTYGL